MKHLPLGVKIGLGFALVLALTVQLGLWSSSQMREARDIVSEIALESTPEVEISSHIEKLTLFAMYDFRGYGMSEEKRFLESGRASWKELKEHFVEAEELIAKYPRLTGLKAGVEEAKTKVAEYDVVLNATVSAIEGLTAARNKINLASEKYLRLVGTAGEDRLRRQAPSHRPESAAVHLQGPGAA
jgi:methyl-accepting chemotaxis protein